MQLLGEICSVKLTCGILCDSTHKSVVIRFLKKKSPLKSSIIFFQSPSDLSRDLYLEAKQLGFADKQIAQAIERYKFRSFLMPGNLVVTNVIEI